MQASAFFEAHEVAYASTFGTGRRIYGSDVPQMTAQEAQSAARAEATQVRMAERYAEVLNPTPQAKRKKSRAEREQEAAETREYARKALERARARAREREAAG